MNDMTRRMRPMMGALEPPPAEPPARPRHMRAGSFGVVDIGTTKVACLIGRTESDGTLRVLGFGWTKARGVRNGGISDIDEAERAIRIAVGQAEDMADLRLQGVTVNLSCGQPESRLMNVQWPIAGRPVTELDIRRVVQEGRARALCDGRDQIHALTLDFAVDETTGVADPRGLYCEQLSARLHVIDAAAGALRNLQTTMARCDLGIEELVSAPIAAGYATLVEDERELGTTLVDMGGGTTSIAVFFEGAVVHTAHLPVGGLHVTNDIARGLSTPIAHAERLKTLYGNAQASPDDDRELLPVPLVGEAEHQFTKVPRSMVVSIIRPRLEETFEMLRDRIDASGLGRAAGGRVVLTGGASQLVGVAQMAQTILGRQVRLGRPTGLRGLPDSATGPAFATSAGLLAWAAGQGRVLQDIDFDSNQPTGLFGRLMQFLRDRL
jgi:cell division protein FtsA